MQHQVHAARAAPHLRGGHHHGHMALPHTHVGPMEQYPGTITAEAASAVVAANTPVAAQQQQQQQQQQRGLHHHGHIAVPHPHAGAMEQYPGTITAEAAAAQHEQQQQPQAQPPPPQRDAHHGRLNLHHQQPLPPQLQPNVAYHNNNISINNNSNSSSSSNNNNQMQKIRQQHQHLSNNNNGHINKCNPSQQPPPPQAYNHLAGNPGAIQYSQLPHHMAHLGSYAAQPPPAVLSAKQQHYYMNNKYNSNNSNNSSNNYPPAPKSILQNTYRNAKSNGQETVATVGAAGAATTVAVVNKSRSSNSNSEDICESAEHAENCDAKQSDDCHSSADHIATAGGTLPNEDSSASRSGKDKTPMCLVNELARYNKITHQYRLTGERGPAHCKTFTVTLKLGEEEYSADGFKIKKAQHLAASKAIEETKYKHPPPKIRRNEEASSTRTHITPTVELNALAMKLGQRTYYLLDPTQMPPTDAMLPPEYAPSLLPTPAAGMPALQQAPPYALRRQAASAAAGYVLSAPPMHPHHAHVAALQTQRGIYGRPFGPKFQSRFALPPALGPHMLPGGPHGPPYPPPPMPVTPSKITLFVGKQKFVGVGRTLQQAKHDAAARALQVLKTQTTNTPEETLDDSMDEGDKKSPISQVHEIGIKRNMTVHFKVQREEGPAHMKNFITACIVGTIITEGEGNGKKISKKRAAEKMLSELQKLPPLSPSKQTPMKRIKVKTPGKSSASAVASLAAAAVTPLGKPERRKRLSTAPVKEKSLLDLDDAENPITKLIQLQQMRKEKEPIFELIAKNGSETSRRREFVMEVSASNNTARGTGNSKKMAKRNAAQALLEQLEAADHSTAVEQSLDNSVAPAVATTAPTLESTAAVEVPMVSTPAGPMPGILILRQNKKPAKKKDVVIKALGEQAKERETKTETTTEEKNSSSGNSSSNDSQGANDAAGNAAESSLNTSTGSNTSGVSSNSSNATANNTAAAGGDGGNGAGGGGVHMKDQLIYLSKLMDFEVNFSDYPKGNHNEFLTIVTISTNPPQICHGVGKSCEESQNAAARNALKILSELGLNTAKK